jgi:hypothetical protein
LRATWKPKTSSVVQVFTSQESEEGSGVSTTQVTSTVGGSWIYGFSQRWRTQNMLVYSNTEVGQNREDELIFGESALTYVIDDGFEFSAKFQRSVRTSTDLTAGFKDNIYSLQLSTKFPEVLGN